MTNGWTYRAFLERRLGLNSLIEAVPLGCSLGDTTDLVNLLVHLNRHQLGEHSGHPPQLVWTGLGQ